MHGLHRPTPWHCCVVLNIVFYSFKNWIILKLNLFINIVLHPGFPQNVTDISHMMAELCMSFSVAPECATYHCASSSPAMPSSSDMQLLSNYAPSLPSPGSSPLGAILRSLETLQ